MGIADDITWSVGNEITYNYYFVRPHYPWIFISNSWSRWCSRPPRWIMHRVCKEGLATIVFATDLLRATPCISEWLYSEKSSTLNPPPRVRHHLTSDFLFPPQQAVMPKKTRTLNSTRKASNSWNVISNCLPKTSITPLLFRPQLVSSLSFRWLFTFHFWHFRRFSLIWGWVPFHSCSDDTKFSETQFRHGAVEKRISPATICIDNEAIFKSLI